MTPAIANVELERMLVGALLIIMAVGVIYSAANQGLVSGLPADMRSTWAVAVIVFVLLALQKVGLIGVKENKKGDDVWS